MKLISFKNIFFFLIGIFFIAWLYNFFSGPESLQYILDHKELGFFLVLAHIPTIYFDSVSWQFLMKTKQLNIYWCFVITWISQTSGKFFPTGNVTGEFVRIFLSTKKGMSGSEASSTVMGDVALAAISLLIMAIFSFLSLIYLYEEFSILGGANKYLFYSILILSLASLIFCFSIRKRFLKSLIKKPLIFFKLNINHVKSLLRFDYELYALSFRIKTVCFALIIRLLGWIGGAFEIYIFFFVIGIDVSLLDVIIIESFTAILRSIIFFIPAGLGVQEIAFVIAGNFVGLSSEISFSAAIGRRIREVLVGIPAIISWYTLFKKTNS